MLYWEFLISLNLLSDPAAWLSRIFLEELYSSTKRLSCFITVADLFISLIWWNIFWKPIIRLNGRIHIDFTPMMISFSCIKARFFCPLVNEYAHLIWSPQTLPYSITRSTKAYISASRPLRGSIGTYWHVKISISNCRVLIWFTECKRVSRFMENLRLL